MMDAFHHSCSQISLCAWQLLRHSSWELSSTHQNNTTENESSFQVLQPSLRVTCLSPNHHIAVPQTLSPRLHFPLVHSNKSPLSSCFPGGPMKPKTQVHFLPAWLHASCDGAQLFSAHMHKQGVSGGWFLSHHIITQALNSCVVN